MASGIYKIEHIASGRIYVGSALCLKKRWKVNRDNLNAGSHYNRKLMNAWRKYGHRAFHFSMLELCRSEVLLKREQYWLNELQPFECRGYNICRVAGSKLGVPQSEAMKAKMRKIHTGREIKWRDKIAKTMNTPAKKEELRKRWTGRNHTEAAKQKMRESANNRWSDPTQREQARQKSLGNTNRRGQTASLETRRKISEAGRNRSCSAATRQKMSEAQKICWAERKQAS